MDTKNCQIIVKGKDKTNEIKSFVPNGDKVEITYFSGSKTYSYLSKDVERIESVLLKQSAKHTFDYLKEIAETVGLKDKQGGNILTNRYSKIGFINPKSMLSSFLLGQTGKCSGVNNDLIIYPFGFNTSQKTAVEKALYNPLSIIEGPPGTGKTQTILNIIANVVMRGESVAVCSSNNSATKNVLDKLKKYEIDFIAAYLGNTDNKKDFINQQKPLPDFSKWKLTSENKNKIQAQLAGLFSKLNEMLEKKNRLARLKQQLDLYSVEYRHFEQYYKKLNILIHGNFFKNKTSDKLLKIWLLSDRYAILSNYRQLFERLKFYFTFGLSARRIFSNLPENIISVCQKQFYERKIEELKSDIQSIETELNNFNFDLEMKTCSELSMQIFRHKVADRYTESTNARTIFEIDDLWKNSDRFIKEYPVVLSTAYSVRSSLSDKVTYNYVIVDEASQVDVATGALALSCAQKAVIVGDLKQLPNVVTDDVKKVTDEIFTKYNLSENYRYSNHSLLLSLTELFPDVPKTLLCEHYRCHPKIIEFCNQKFYNNQLVVLTDSKSNRKPLILYKTVEGNHARNRVNQRQIDVIKNEIIPQQKLDIGNGSVGIVTPYRNQTNALQAAFANTKVKADTVDKFQGQENEVIILSTVDNEISDFADNANRLNVAVSRAINQLIVVVNGNDTRNNTNISDLVKYIEYNNLEIIQSQIHSVFDLLYKKYNEKCETLPKISPYNSENSMYNLIKQILQEEQFSRFDVTVHFPLRMILNNTDKLNNEEAKYALNPLTHIDFLIFEKIGKQPRLAIEVDGFSFHRKGTQQAERDAMKDSILTKYGIPIERFKTNESGEKERLMKKLMEIQ